MPIALTNDNYYSPQANVDYMSVSQFKDFAGTTAHKSCELAAYRKFVGQYQEQPNTAMLIGSYVDSYFEGTLDRFREENMDLLFTKASVKKFSEGKGPLELYADFRKAENIIERITSDPVFMSYLSGDPQVIMTGNLFGTDWKIKMDFFFANDKIVDLKIMKDMKPLWAPDIGRKVDFIHYWGYDIQAAVYQKIVEMNTGRKLPFFIACATKEDITDYNLIEITQPHMDAALQFVEDNIQHVLALKSGAVTPVACGTCATCRLTKRLTGPVTIDSIMPVDYRNDMASEDDGGDGGAPVSLWD
jgi:hypothetical protein